MQYFGISVLHGAMLRWHVPHVTGEQLRYTVNKYISSTRGPHHMIKHIYIYIYIFIFIYVYITQCVCSTCMRVVLTTYISRIPDCGWGRIVWLAGVADMQSSTTEVFYEWVPTHMTQFTTQLGTDENENIQRSRASMQPCAQGCARETKQRSYMLMHTIIEPVCNRSTVTCTIDNRRV